MRQLLEPSILVALLALGCAAPRRASFEITFASPALGERAVRAEVTVLEGSCRGTVLHRDTFDARGQGASIAPLRPGVYGFRARVIDAACAVYAEGCTQVSLPIPDARVVVVVAERAPSALCAAEACAGGSCAPGALVDAGTELVDAGVPVAATDAGALDGGEDAVDASLRALDGGGPPPLDAGVPSPIDAGAPALELVPTNIPPALLALGTAELVVRAADEVVVLDTDDGSIHRLSDRADRRPAGLVVSVLPQLGGAPDLAVLSLRALRIEAGAELRVVGAAALVLAVRDEVIIEGRLDADADGRSAGPGGFEGGTLSSRAGRGPGGGGAGPSATDVGGGGGGHLAVGGAGGDTGGTRGGAGGGSCGDADLSPLVGGSGGAAGGGTNAAGEGGGGGGAVQISSARIVVAASGAIDCAGGGGAGGALDDAAGGGGAGGAILLEALTLEVRGALVAIGGGGGAGANLAVRGADGEPGQTAERAARGGAGAGEGTGGGAGGASGSTRGGDGVDATGSLDNAGGGGGSAGRVRLRAASAMLDGAVLSPREGVVSTGL